LVRRDFMQLVLVPYKPNHISFTGWLKTGRELL
jgi:hypothetical protein